MAHTIEESRAKSLFELMQEFVSNDPDQLLLSDIWDRECFSKFVDHKFSDAEWKDFVGFCSNELMPWADWFLEWKDGGRKV
jgi:hypothetical protein